MTSLVPSGALPLGLGCSRLGSVGGATPNQSRALLRRAIDEGVRFFDTSNIYGQGDSERLLAEVLADHDDAVIASKGGKFVSWQRRMLLPLKEVIVASAQRSPATQDRVAKVRARPMPTRWDAGFLTKSLEGSLRRLKRERVDVFLLHSPSIDVIQAGDAMSALDRARAAGKIGLAGVSVDDSETALACLADTRVKVLQIPLLPRANEYAEVLDQAARARVPVIAREILGGSSNQQRIPSTAARARICELVRDPLVSIPLVGATRIATLTDSAEAARIALQPDTNVTQPPHESNPID
ncbi:aldo/keto reductase [Mycolicibacterium pulveris]|uniref:aldo/keto reductase n=1 Tax=Mycolicibacterium pulveris TaxID=36813 RepID=UPI003CE9C71F